MTAGTGRRKQGPLTLRGYRVLQILLWCLLPLGPLEIIYAVHTAERDRLSLQWPQVSGTIVQSQRFYRPSGRYTFYSADVDYVYRVDGRNYAGNRIKLWDPKLERENNILDSFVAAHPAGSTVDVYYDPKQPEKSVLIPGADERSKTFYTWNGALLTILTIPTVFRSRKFFAKAITRAKAVEAARAAHPRAEKIAGLPHAFVSYEPGSRLKLNCFPDKRCLEEVLGQKGKKLQDWQPEDRVIDTDGQEYRLAPLPDRKSYHLEPTGTKWSCEQLLDIAEADAGFAKANPALLRRHVEEAPAERKMAVLMEGIDHLPAGSRWFILGWLFLLVFFLVVLFIACKVTIWVQRLI